MNKANVFLLVVVSSLLTYISTATQPAATAGVAQEKWEYGRSHFYTHPSGSQGLLFKTGGNYSFKNYKVRRVVNKKDGTAIEIKIPGREEILRDHYKEYEKFYELCHLLWTKLGDAGWHPYQVVPNEIDPDSLNTQFRETVYWRRRVQ